MTDAERLLPILFKQWEKQLGDIIGPLVSTETPLSARQQIQLLAHVTAHHSGALIATLAQCMDLPPVVRQRVIDGAVSTLTNSANNILAEDSPSTFDFRALMQKRP